MKTFFLFLTMIFAFSINLNAQDNSVPRNTTTELAPGTNRPSDISGNPNALVWGSRWMGQNAAATSFFTKGFLNTSGTLSNFGPSSTSLYGAMEFSNTGTLYCVAVAVNSPLQTLDTTTGVLTTLGPITGHGTEQILGMSFNRANNTMYMTTIATGSTDKLYSLNLSTRVATFIGATTQNLFDIAINSQGQCYGVSVTDNLVSINLTTGIGTVIGPIGFDANFIQGLSFDRSTDSLWYAAYNQTAGSGQLRKVNLTTGATTLIASFTGAAEVCGFAIPAPGTTPPPAVKNFALSLPIPGVNTNYVSIPHQASMIGFNNVTIEGWVKIGGTATPNTVLNKGAASFDYQLGINATTANPFFRAGVTVVIATTVTVTPGVWTHLAATYDGTTVRFYKDGALAFSQASALTLGSSANEMRIGRGNNDPGSGNIEELRLWSVARSQGQIDTNKCRKYPGSFTSSTGLKAVWHLDSTLTDSISSYNGTPLGTVGFDTVSFPVPGASCILVGIQPSSNEIPSVYSLDQNYPNPFNPTTTIRFAIPKGSFVEVKLFDVLGTEIKTLLSDPLEAGQYSINFNGEGLPSGVYFYKIIAGNFTDSKKMLLIK